MGSTFRRSPRSSSTMARDARSMRICSGAVHQSKASERRENSLRMRGSSRPNDQVAHAASAHAFCGPSVHRAGPRPQKCGAPRHFDSRRAPRGRRSHYGGRRARDTHPGEVGPAGNRTGRECSVDQYSRGEFPLEQVYAKSRGRGRPPARGKTPSWQTSYQRWSNGEHVESVATRRRAAYRKVNTAVQHILTAAQHASPVDFARLSRESKFCVTTKDWAKMESAKALQCDVLDPAQSAADRDFVSEFVGSAITSVPYNKRSKRGNSDRSSVHGSQVVQSAQEGTCFSFKRCGRIKTQSTPRSFLVVSNDPKTPTDKPESLELKPDAQHDGRIARIIYISVPAATHIPLCSQRWAGTHTK